MAVTTFAAIDISSYEISMKIFEFSRKGGFRTVDDIRYRLNLGVGVYSGGTMEVDKVDTICEVLGDFKRIMAEYGVKEYRACTTSVFPSRRICTFSKLPLAYSARTASLTSSGVNATVF